MVGAERTEVWDGSRHGGRAGCRVRALGNAKAVGEDGYTVLAPMLLHQAS